MNILTMFDGRVIFSIFAFIIPTTGFFFPCPTTSPTTTTTTTTMTTTTTTTPPTTTTTTTTATTIHPITTESLLTTQSLTATLASSLVSNATSFEAVGSSWNYIYTTLAPKRLMSPGWSGVLSRVQCASKTLQGFPQARGFLYHSGSGLCTPLLWLEGVASPAASLVTPEEGTIYLDPVICDQQYFLVYEYGTGGDLACLRTDRTSLQDFATAQSSCADIGSFLVEVRSLDKRNLISSLAGSDNIWIGLDDRTLEGVFVYHVDGVAITQDESDAIFGYGQPSDSGGDQDCAQFNAGYDAVGDTECYNENHFVCEIPLDGEPFVS